MFTIKFIKNIDEGVVTDNVSCPFYEVFERNEGVVSIACYPDFFNKNGVERHISKNPQDYNHAFVMNDKGKTIDRIVTDKNNLID